MTILSVLAEILFVGHSLVGPNLPPLLEVGLIARGQTEARVRAQVINGAPLAWQWDHSAEAEGVDARVVLATEDVDALVLTEAIPLADQVQWNDSATQVARFAALAWERSPETRVYLYETWHSLASGPGAVIEGDAGAGVPWRERLVADLPVWEGLGHAANAARPPGADPVRIIPAGQAMGLVADAAAAGQLPGIDDIRDLFADDIHPNGKGLYLVAMVHLATLSGQSPEGLPARLTRQWQNRESVISDDLALALQRIAWQAAEAQRLREDAGPSAPLPVAVPEPAAPAPAPVDLAALTPVTNPALALGLAGVNDWTVQQPFLDVMKTARPWTGHLPGQWGGMTHDELQAAGWLDENGWPKAIPPQLTGLATLVLTDLPADAGGVAGRYVLRWQGRGEVLVEGLARNLTPVPGGLAFDYLPGPGAVILTIAASDPADPLRAITLVREDRQAALDGGAIFNPDWLGRIRGVKAIRFMDWMMANDSTLARIEDSPKVDDFTWARNGVPIEVMVALANELDADPWFTMPHLADDALNRFYAETVAELLEPGLRAHVEYSNEVWNLQFAQARWAEDQGRARWGREWGGTQFYGLRAAEVMAIWSAAFGEAAPRRLVRVVAVQTGVPGMEEAILTAPLAVADGARPPVESFDAYAVTGYFSGLLGTEEKVPLVRGWLAKSAAADPAQPYALAVARAAEEMADGRHSGMTENSLEDLLTRILPYQAGVARKHGLTLMMYEGGTHVVGIGPVVEDAELAAFFQHLNYTPEVGALYTELLEGWAKVTDAPFNAFVDVYSPGKWGSWGALRHLGDDNPRWLALARGCGGC